MPWFLSFLDSQVVVQCNKCTVPAGYHFVMIYEAFDSTLESLGLQQLNHGGVRLEHSAYYLITLSPHLSEVMKICFMFLIYNCT